MARFDDILESIESYSTVPDVELIKKAYVFSGVVHQGQTRRSGEPYMSHPIEVAAILTSLKMDASTIATGLLHDTVEDTHTTLEKIEELFGTEISDLVDGLTKLSKITFEKKEEHEAENFRKMILAMAKDIRIIMIKLADRLHNMRTLDALAPDRQEAIARETLDIYAPLANRIGIGWMKTELEDHSFKYLFPDKYKMFQEKLERSTEEREKHLATVKEDLDKELLKHGVEGEVTGRLKHSFSIYKKMEENDIDFDSVYDIIAFRVIVDSIKDCYSALGIIHSIWKPVPGRFKDYIAIPKPNMYQSLHTTIFGPYGERVEIQIRTEEMHRTAEYGIAAHWKYKEGKYKDGGQVVTRGMDSSEDRNFAWLRQLLEWQRDLKDPGEFMDTFKVDLFPEEVFVFTPKGDAKQLASGSTPLDFAYAIHTDIGHRCYGARINGKSVSLRSKLRSGDVVEVLTSERHRPRREWLEFVATSKAKARIRQWIKNEDREQSVLLGSEICEKEFSKYGLDFHSLVESGDIEKVARESFDVMGVETLKLRVGHGKVSVSSLISKFVDPDRIKEEKKSKSMSGFRKVFNRLTGSSDKNNNDGVVIKGDSSAMVKFAKCCSPLPGDSIVGFITLGQGVAVHVNKCPHVLDIDEERKVDVSWDKNLGEPKSVRINILCRNEKGLLADMSNVIKFADANVSAATIKTTNNNRAACVFDIDVESANHLKNVIGSLRKIKNVIKVERVIGASSQEIK